MDDTSQGYDGQALALGAARPLSRGTTLVSRLSRRADGGEFGPWYARPWVTFVAMYVFLPLGLYLMWRYRPWPRWLKWANTILGPLGALLWTYIARRLMGDSLPLP